MDQVIHICVLNLNGITFCHVFLLSLKSCDCYFNRRSSWRVRHPTWKNVASNFHKPTMHHVVIFFMHTVFLLFLYLESFPQKFLLAKRKFTNLGVRLFMQQVSRKFKSHEILLNLKFKLSNLRKALRPALS